MEIQGVGVLGQSKIEGPIAASAPGDPSHDYPFSASALDLKSRDYVEQEFFIQGMAHWCNTPAQAVGTILGPSIPTTRGSWSGRLKPHSGSAGSIRKTLPSTSSLPATCVSVNTYKNPSGP